jgi:hypothetical protein
MDGANTGSHATTQQADVFMVRLRLIFARETPATTEYSLNVEHPM